MADHASENKNNTLLAFLTELIYLKIFDTVELYYGPVGHTHNGRDVNHHVHNNMVGNFECISLPEFFFKAFYAVWVNPKDFVLNPSSLTSNLTGTLTMDVTSAPSHMSRTVWSNQDRAWGVEGLIELFLEGNA